MSTATFPLRVTVVGSTNREAAQAYSAVTTRRQYAGDDRVKEILRGQLSRMDSVFQKLK